MRTVKPRIVPSIKFFLPNGPWCQCPRPEFAARLKDAVDLDSIRDDLAGAVDQALEPAHISVWITQQE